MRSRLSLLTRARPPRSIRAAPGGGAGATAWSVRTALLGRRCRCSSTSTRPAGCGRPSPCRRGWTWLDVTLPILPPSRPSSPSILASLADTSGRPALTSRKSSLLLGLCLCQLQHRVILSFWQPNRPSLHPQKDREIIHAGSNPVTRPQHTMAAKTRDDAVTADTAVDRRVESGDHSQKERGRRGGARRKGQRASLSTGDGDVRSCSLRLSFSSCRPGGCRCHSSAFDFGNCLGTRTHINLPLPISPLSSDAVEQSCSAQRSLGKETDSTDRRRTLNPP